MKRNFVTANRENLGMWLPVSLQVVMLKAREPTQNKSMVLPRLPEITKSWEQQTAKRTNSHSHHHSLSFSPCRSLCLELYYLYGRKIIIIFSFEHIQGRECRQCAEILFYKMEKFIWNDNHFPGNQFHCCISRSVPGGRLRIPSSIIPVVILGATRGGKSENNAKQEMLT